MMMEKSTYWRDALFLTMSCLLDALFCIRIQPEGVIRLVLPPVAFPFPLQS